jgi:hypothetical protein
VIASLDVFRAFSLSDDSNNKFELSEWLIADEEARHMETTSSVLIRDQEEFPPFYRSLFTENTFSCRYFLPQRKRVDIDILIPFTEDKPSNFENEV